MAAETVAMEPSRDVGVAAEFLGEDGDLKEVNQWADVENYCAALEMERSSLTAEVSRLRTVNEFVGDNVSLQNPASAEFAQVQGSLEEAKIQSESRLADTIAERARAASLAAELESKIKDMATMSSEKLQLFYENSKLQAELVPSQEECVRLRKEVLERQSVEDSLKARLEELRAERSAFRCESARKILELQEEASSAKADAAFHARVAEEARDGQRLARQHACEAEDKLQEREENFAETRASLERKVLLKDDQIQRLTETQDDIKKNLTDINREKESALETRVAAMREAEQLRDENSLLAAKFASLDAEHEALLRRCIPGADDADVLHEGFQSISDLVRLAKDSKEAATNEKQMREQLQEVLQEVEREVRARYPALQSQREDAERFRTVATRLARENENLLSQLKQLQDSRRSAEVRARKAERSEQILEEHARDITRQLAVVVNENRKLTGAPLSSAGTAKSLDAEPHAFKKVQDLVVQNENLRKAVARLRAEADTEAQREVQALKTDRKEMEEDWKKHLEEKAVQMKALANAVAIVTQERDDAQRALMDCKAAASAAVVTQEASNSPQPVPKEPSQEIKALAEEHGKRVNELKNKISELRASDLKSKQDFAMLKGKFDFECGRRKNADAALQKRGSELDDCRSQLNRIEQTSKGFDERRKEDETSKREVESQLAQVKKEAALAEKRTRQHEAKVSELERTNASLVAEKAAHIQAVSDLQARSAREADLYTELKRSVEASFKREEQVLTDKLATSQQRNEDLSKNVEVLSAVRLKLQQDVLEFQKVADALKETNAQLKDDVKEAESKVALSHQNVEASRFASGTVEDAPRLQQALKLAEEREIEYKKTANTWKTLSEEQEKELKDKGVEITNIQKILDETLQQNAKVETEAATLREASQDSDAHTQELARKLMELQGSLEGREAEIAKVRLESEKCSQKSVSDAEDAKQQSRLALVSAEDWERKHNRIIQDHGLTISELDTLKTRYFTLDREVRELREKSSALQGEATRARAERADEVDTLKTRLEQEEEHNRVLVMETKRYQEHLVAIAGRGGETKETTELLQLDSQAAAVREQDEKRRQQLEVEKARVEREARALQLQVETLQKSLAQEQRTVLRLQSEVRSEQRAISKMGQFALLEDENLHLSENLKVVEAELEEIKQKRDKDILEATPVSKQLASLKRKEETWERRQRELEATADEWKRLHEEVVVRFEAKDATELRKEVKHLKEEALNVAKQKQQALARVEGLQEDLRQKNQELAGNQALKMRNEELQGLQKQSQTKNEGLNKRVADLERELGSAKTESGLYLLHKRRVEELEKSASENATVKARLEADFKKAQESLKSNAATSAAAKKVEEAAASARRKVEEELQATQVRADKAVAMAMDFQRVAEGLVSEKKRATAEAKEHAKERQDTDIREREARDTQNQPSSPAPTATSSNKDAATLASGSAVALATSPFGIQSSPTGTASCGFQTDPNPLKRKVSQGSAAHDVVSESPPTQQSSGEQVVDRAKIPRIAAQSGDGADAPVSKDAGGNIGACSEP